MKKKTYICICFFFYSLYIFVRIWFSYSKLFGAFGLICLVYSFLFSADISLVWCFQQVVSNFPLSLLLAVCSPLIVIRLLLLVWWFGWWFVVYIQKRTRLKSKCVYFVCVYFIVQLLQVSFAGRLFVCKIRKCVLI